MATEASDRHRLYDAARQSWGDEAADTLMDLLPPDGDAAATKAHVSLLGSELRTEIAVVRTEMSELRTEMAQFRTEMGTEMAQLRTEMGRFQAEIRTEMGRFQTEIGIEMADFRTEMHIDMEALRTEVHTVTSNLGADLYKAMANQTRTFVFANVGMIFSGLGLAFAAARFAGN